MPPSHDLIGRVLIHRELEGLRLNQLSPGVESRPLRSQPDPFRCKILFSLYQIQFQLCHLRIMLGLIHRVNRGG